MVVETRCALLGAQVREGGVGEVESQQSVKTCRVAIPDSEGVAELPDARIPAGTAAERNMAPAHTEIIYKITGDRSRPVANCVVNWRR